MERKLELIRTILLEVEKRARPGRLVDVEISGHAPEEIAYHVGLLHEAGYVEAAAPYRAHGSGRSERPARSLADATRLVRSLTWKGHEFLDATRTETVWRQVLARLKDRGAPFDVVGKLAAQIGASMLGVR